VAALKNADGFEVGNGSFRRWQGAENELRSRTGSQAKEQPFPKDPAKPTDMSDGRKMECGIRYWGSGAVALALPADQFGTGLLDRHDDRVAGGRRGPGHRLDRAAADPERAGPLDDHVRAA